MTAVSKVTLNGQTLMDATTATASANEIISPYTAMTADGVMTAGTGSAGGAPWTNDETVLASGTFDSATQTAWHTTPIGLTIGDFRRFKYFKLTLKMATVSSIYIRLVSKDFRFVESQSNTQHDILVEFLDKEHRFYRYWTCGQYVRDDADSPILSPIVGSSAGSYPSFRESKLNLKIGYIPEDLADTEQLALLNQAAQTGDGAWKIRGAIEE